MLVDSCGAAAMPITAHIDNALGQGTAIDRIIHNVMGKHKRADATANVPRSPIAVIISDPSRSRLV
jgi:hypothetical protein